MKNGHQHTAGIIQADMTRYYADDDEFLTQVQYLTDKRVIKLQDDGTLDRICRIGHLVIESHRTAYLMNSRLDSFRLGGVKGIEFPSFPKFYFPEGDDDC